MDLDLHELLVSLSWDDSEGQEISEGSSFSVVSCYGPEKEWNLQSSQLTKFWKEYCRLVDQNFEGNYGLAEKPSMESMPVLAEFVFSFSQEAFVEAGEPFGDVLLYGLIHVYQEEIEKKFKISSEKTELICACLESDDWQERVENEMLCFLRIRLQFPFCRTDPRLQKELRFRVIERLQKGSYFDLFETPPRGDWNSLLQKNTVQMPVMMYGSSEKEDRPKLRLRMILPFLSSRWVGETREEFDLDEIQEQEQDIANIFRPDNHKHVHHALVNRSIFVENMNYDHWLPLFLSLGYWNEIVFPRKLSSGEKRTSPSLPSGVSSNEGGEESFSLALELLKLLGPERFQEENYWLDVGKALFHSVSGEEAGLKVWQDYTRRYAPHRWEDCEEWYPTWGESNLTVKTLAWYARLDHPEEYKTWHTGWIKQSMEKALSCLHTDATECFYRMYWLDYICCESGCSTRWFQFRNHHWMDISKGTSLRRCLSSVFLRKFEAYRTAISRSIQESTDEAERTKWEGDIKKVGTLLAKLKTVTYKNHLMKEAIEFFNEPKFFSWCNDNDVLTGVKNGVFEICQKQCVFRAGKPEDYLTKTTLVPYYAHYHWKHPLVEELMEWLKKVFPDQALLEHFLKYCASFLISKNREKLLVVFTGSGDNSKSMVCKLFGLFGSYCVRLPIACITQKRGRSNGPNPELARTQGAKIVITQEPETTDQLKSGMVKDTTGGDPFFARFLNDNGGEIKNTFKFILMCNKIPVIPNPDKAIHNRLRILPFLSVWVDNPPESEEEQWKQRTFQKDPFFEDRIAVLMPAFLWVLKEYYPRYASEGLKDPEIVRKHTEEYWKSTDIYEQFNADRISVARKADGKQDEKAKLALGKIYESFKDWFRENYPGLHPPDRNVVRDNLITRWGPMKGRYWYGLELKEISRLVPPGAIEGELWNPYGYTGPIGPTVSDEGPMT